jgi:hypothetical protein
MSMSHRTQAAALPFLAHRVLAKGSFVELAAAAGALKERYGPFRRQLPFGWQLAATAATATSSQALTGRSTTADDTAHPSDRGARQAAAAHRGSLQRGRAVFTVGSAVG